MELDTITLREIRWIQKHITCFFLYAIPILDFLNAMEIEGGIFVKKTRGREEGEGKGDVRW